MRITTLGMEPPSGLLLGEFPEVSKQLTQSNCHFPWVAYYNITVNTYS